MRSLCETTIQTKKSPHAGNTVIIIMRATLTRPK